MLREASGVTCNARDARLSFGQLLKYVLAHGKSNMRQNCSVAGPTALVPCPRARGTVRTAWLPFPDMTLVDAAAQCQGLNATPPMLHGADTVLMCDIVVAAPVAASRDDTPSALSVLSSCFQFCVWLAPTELVPVS